MSEGRRRVMEYVCQQRITLTTALYGGAVGLLFDIGALLIIEPGTSAHVVALLNLPGLILITVLAGVILRKCARST